MSRIIAGRFDRTVDADAAVEALRREGFAGEEIDSFYVPPPGQHSMTPLGGDAPRSAPTSGRSSGPRSSCAADAPGRRRASTRSSRAADA